MSEKSKNKACLLKALSQSHHQTSASVLEDILVSLELSLGKLSDKTYFSSFHVCHTYLIDVFKKKKKYDRWDCHTTNQFYLLKYTVKFVSMPISSCTRVTANLGRVKLLWSTQKPKSFLCCDEFAARALTNPILGYDEEVMGSVWRILH